MDSFLDRVCIPLAVERYSLEAELVRRLKPAANALRDMPESWFNWIAPQYFAHTLFRKNGRAKDHLAALERRGCAEHEKVFVRERMERPWRFVFCKVDRSVGHDCHVMSDMIEGGSFLLYSPALSRTQVDIPNICAFLLLLDDLEIGYQTYGPIMYFVGLQAWDIQYLARLIDPKASTPASTAAVIDANPVPFMALARGAMYPMVVHKQDLLVHCMCTVAMSDFDPEPFAGAFTIEKKGSVTRLELTRMSGHPHFARIYHDADKHRVEIHAATMRGWNALVTHLTAAGYNIPPDAIRTVSFGYRELIHELLGKKTPKDSYEALFSPPPPTAAQNREIEKMNALFDEYTEELSRGVRPDIDALAARYGVDPAVVAEVARTLDSLHASRERPPKRRPDSRRR